MSSVDFILILVLIVVVAAISFIAGYRAAAAYLPAARAVSEVSNAAIVAANDFTTALDKNQAALASLRDVIEASTNTNAERQRAIEDALQTLFVGFERAGLVRSTRTVPRQHGEAATDD